MKLTAKIRKDQKVEVEALSLTIKFVGQDPKLQPGDPVELESPNRSQSHLDAKCIVDKVLGKGEYQLKFDSHTR